MKYLTYQARIKFDNHILSATLEKIPRKGELIGFIDPARKDYLIYGVVEDILYIYHDACYIHKDIDANKEHIKCEEPPQICIILSDKEPHIDPQKISDLF